MASGSGVHNRSMADGEYDAWHETGRPDCDGPIITTCGGWLRIRVAQINIPSTWTKLLMSNVTIAARSLLKTMILRSPFGPSLQTWYRGRRSVQDLFRWTPTDEAALRFYTQFIGPNDICFDVGANRGVRTKVFRRLAAKVVAVEPQRSCTAILHGAYDRDANVSVVSAACGAAPGSAVIHVSGADSLSSLSEEWIFAVTGSGRFRGEWTREEPCVVVTLDDLIRSYGRPSFIKIDVEGYELNVLKGLTHPVPCVSFEFTPERFDAAVECADYLCALGFSRFNVSWGDSFALFLDSWLGRDSMVSLLQQYREDYVIFGDIYARLGD